MPFGYGALRIISIGALEIRVIQEAHSRMEHLKSSNIHIA